MRLSLVLKQSLSFSSRLTLWVPLIGYFAHNSGVSEYLSQASFAQNIVEGHRLNNIKYNPRVYS